MQFIKIDKMKNKFNEKKEIILINHLRLKPEFAFFKNCYLSKSQNLMATDNFQVQA
jgi:hypothetical protein